MVYLVKECEGFLQVHAARSCKQLTEFRRRIIPKRLPLPDPVSGSGGLGGEIVRIVDLQYATS